jgi:hypothetical protein
VIELLDFNLRGGSEAPIAAARAANVTERYLSRTGARDLTAVVTELVGWLGGGDPAPRTMRLELSVTATTVRVSVTVAQRSPKNNSLDSNKDLREAFPVTAALASRYGAEASRRLRVWAEFDRRATDVPAYTES